MEGDGNSYRMSVKLESYETFLQLRPIDIWYWCAKLLNTQSPPLPQQNLGTYNWLKVTIIDVGESIIRHAKYKHICQTTLEKIEEIITDTEKLMD